MMDNTSVGSDGFYNRTMDQGLESITHPNTTGVLYFWEENAGHIIEGYSTLCTMTIGTIGNSLCIATLLHMSRFNSTNLYLTNLAVADLILCIFAQLLKIIPRSLAAFNTLALHPLICKSSYFINHSATGISGWTLVALTVERTLVIYLPLKAKSICTVSHARRIIIFINLFLCAIHLHYFWTYGRKYKMQYDEMILVRHCATATTNPVLLSYMKNIRGWQDFIMRSAGPFVCLMICNCAIIYKLLKGRKLRIKLNAVPDEENKQNDMKSLTLMLLSVSFVYLFCITPIQIMYLIYGSDPNGWKIQYQWQAQVIFIWSFGAMLKNINHSINFLLYLISARQFRISLREMLTRLCCKTTVTP